MKLLLELIITCTGLWLACFVILFLYIWLFILPRLLSTGLLLLLSKLYAILCLRETLGSDWVFVFWRPRSLDFLHFAVCFPCFNPMGLWWNCAFWIDYNMHWSLIGFFVILLLSTWLFILPRLLSSGLLLLLSKLYAILCLKETLGFDWVFVFWRPKNLDFLHFAFSVPCFNPLRLWWNCFLNWL